MISVELVVLLIAWGVAAGSPGPATMAIAGTAMQSGRAGGLAISAGITAGSATWGCAAALGLSAVMLTHAWLLEVVRYAGAAYLLWLALKSLRSALTDKGGLTERSATGSLKTLFLQGYLIHLTNPKAVLGWGALFAVALPAGATSIVVWQYFGMLILVSAFVFLGYGVLFSIGGAIRAYAALRRWFELVFAALFGVASIRILTARIE